MQSIFFHTKGKRFCILSNTAWPRAQGQKRNLKVADMLIYVRHLPRAQQGMAGWETKQPLWPPAPPSWAKTEHETWLSCDYQNESLNLNVHDCHVEKKTLQTFSPNLSCFLKTYLFPQGNKNVSACGVASYFPVEKHRVDLFKNSLT